MVPPEVCNSATLPLLLGTANVTDIQLQANQSGTIQAVLKESREDSRCPEEGPKSKVRQQERLFKDAI